MYGPDFYDLIRAGCQRSAQALVPMLLETFEPRTVVDIGCGEGWWAHAFAKLGGCDVTGIDSSADGGAALKQVDGDPYVTADLTQPLRVGRFDLAVCLEVAEHLPESAADGFIKQLCAVAPVVVFSAALPGQGGVGHINEQWPDYWAERFTSNGYAVSGALRWRIWTDDRIENWYRQNLLVATDQPWRYPALFDTPMAPPVSVVHPVLWDSRR